MHQARSYLIPGSGMDRSGFVLRLVNKLQSRWVYNDTDSICSVA